jgi:hypothetical protein
LGKKAKSKYKRPAIDLTHEETTASGEIFFIKIFLHYRIMLFLNTFTRLRIGASKDIENIVNYFSNSLDTILFDLEFENKVKKQKRIKTFIYFSYKNIS